MSNSEYPSIINKDMFDTLEAAIMSGAREVYYGDKRVVYRSLPEMMQIRDMAARQLGLWKPAESRQFGEFGTGLHS